MEKWCTCNEMGSVPFKVLAAMWPMGSRMVQRACSGPPGQQPTALSLLAPTPCRRSLKVHHNELVFRSLAPPLACCTALELLNLSCCGLRSFPSEVRCRRWVHACMHACMAWHVQ